MFVSLEWRLSVMSVNAADGKLSGISDNKWLCDYHTQYQMQ